MKKNQPDPDSGSRERILEAATRIFAAKGFDGARVDEIAAEAGVNKALIYYYFRSKDGLLEEVFAKITHDYVNQKLAMVRETDFHELKDSSDIADKSYQAIKARKTIIKIALSEALKDGKNGDALFQIMDRSYARILPALDEKGVQLDKYNDAVLFGFFYGFAPVIMALVLGEKWAEYYHMDMDEFEARFIQRMADYTMQFYHEFLVKTPD